MALSQNQLYSCTAPAGIFGAVNGGASNGGFLRRLLWWTLIKPYRVIVLSEHPMVHRFTSNRSTHLAGMIAYFAIFSIIPGLFVLFSVLAMAGHLEDSGWIINQLVALVPGNAARQIVAAAESLRHNAGSLSLVGIVGLLYGTSNFLSSIESALNIIYGVNNRVFIKQKIWVLFLMVAAIGALTTAVIVTAGLLPILRSTESFKWLTESVQHFDTFVSIGVSSLFAAWFFISCYRFLPNLEVHTREVWRGAVLATVLFQVLVHLLPGWLSIQGNSVVVKAFAGALLVLVWFYLMAIILLGGAVYNWWYAEKQLLKRTAGH